MEEAQQAAEAAKSKALEEAQAEGEREKERALSDRSSELKKEFDSKIAALHRANEDAMGKLRAEHEQAAKEAASRESKLTDELAGANEALANLHKQKEEGEASRDAQISMMQADLTSVTGERDDLRQKVEERDARVITMEAELASNKEDLASALSALESTQARLEKAQQKWTEDSASLEGAKDALAAALAKIEEAEKRPIE